MNGNPSKITSFEPNGNENTRYHTIDCALGCKGETLEFMLGNSKSKSTCIFLNYHTYSILSLKRQQPLPENLCIVL